MAVDFIVDTTAYRRSIARQTNSVAVSSSDCSIMGLRRSLVIARDEVVTASRNRRTACTARVTFAAANSDPSPEVDRVALTATNGTDLLQVIRATTFPESGARTGQVSKTTANSIVRSTRDFVFCAATNR